MKNLLNFQKNLIFKLPNLKWAAIWAVAVFTANYIISNTLILAGVLPPPTEAVYDLFRTVFKLGYIIVIIISMVSSVEEIIPFVGCVKWFLLFSKNKDYVSILKNVVLFSILLGLTFFFTINHDYQGMAAMLGKVLYLPISMSIMMRYGLLTCMLGHFLCNFTQLTYYYFTL